MANSRYCEYYQAYLKIDKTWLVTGILRNEDHLVFDRTLDIKTGLMEFFVIKDYEDKFLSIMNYFVERGLVSDLRKLENRLMTNGTHNIN